MGVLLLTGRVWIFEVWLEAMGALPLTAETVTPAPAWGLLALCAATGPVTNALTSIALMARIELSRILRFVLFMISPVPSGQINILEVIHVRAVALLSDKATEKWMGAEIVSVPPSSH